MKNAKCYGFLLVKYTNPFDKIVEKKKIIKIRRVCQFVAKEYLTKKYVDTKEFDFIEREY